MNDIKSFHELLEHYRFTDAVPAPFRKSALRSQKSLFKKILKEVDEYTLFFGLCLTVLFFLSRVGLKMSLGAVKIITASLLVVVVTVPATYTVAKVKQYYQEKRINTEERIEEAALVEKEESPHVKKENRITALTPGTKIISFRGLRIAGKDQALAREFSGIVKNELKRVLNTRRLLALASGSHRADYSLVGSLRQKETGYFISLRLVDVRSGEIIQGEYFTAPISEDFKHQCRSAVKKLVLKISEDE